MSKFYADKGQFWLDGEPIFIQAGEFHYFRTPADQWNHRLGLLKAAGFNTLATYIPWIWHQLTEGHSDFNGQTHPMRDLEGFLDLAADMGFFIIPRPGPYIMAETINEGIPPWVFQSYPQVAFISQDQKSQNVASYLHPDFLACVRKWYQAVFSVLAPRQITRGGKIIMIQLDNEMGMMAWVRSIMDVNPDTISRLANYIRDTYSDSLSKHYPADHLEDFIFDGIVHTNPAFTAQITADYRCFYREYIREYTIYLWAEAVENGMEVLPVVNIHGFANGGKTFPIGLSQLIKSIELNGMISATDVYPGLIGEGNFHQLLLVNEMTKTLQNKDQALFSIEFQAGGNLDFGNGQSSLYDLHTRLCISSGMRAINHYLFCDGENDPILSPVKRHDWGHPVRKDGTLRSHYHRYPKLSRVLSCYGQDLILSKPKIVTTIGFLIDNFMTEVDNDFTREATNLITHQREMILFDMIARGLALTHRPFNSVELSRAELDPELMPSLWVMIEKQCDAKVQRKLVDYIKQGGRLILVGRMCVEDSNHNACTVLKDAVGIHEIKEFLPYETYSISAFGYHDIPVSFLETFRGAFDEVFATNEQGEAVGLIQSVGKGKVLLFGAAMAANTLDDLDVVNQMAIKMGCPSLFNLSKWVDVRISQGERGSFLFINNYQDDPIDTTIEYQGTTLFGGNSVHLPARQGSILPIEWDIKPGIHIHYVTSEITTVDDLGSSITLKTAQDDFFAEITLAGYECDPSITISRNEPAKRFGIHSKDGTIVLRREE